MEARKDGNFSVKSFYSALEGSNTVPFLRSIIWSPFVLAKVSFFLLGKPLGVKL